MPDLKGMKTFKPPAALKNVYYDLRDRRLLPLVALVVVAIVAIPFLLGSDAKEPDPSPSPTAEAALEDAANSQAITVIEATPGLRDYTERLNGRTPTDPFRQRYAGGPEEAKLESSLSEPTPSEGSSSSFEETVTVEDGSTSVEVEPDGSGEPSGGSDGTGGSTGEDFRLIEFLFDIQVSRTELTLDGGQRWSEPELRSAVPSLTQLPGKKNTVATVGGINLLNDKVFILVSDDVKALDGEFVCKTRTQGGLCELLELEVNVPLELLAANDVRHRIKVVGIEPVWAGQSNAPQPRGRRGFGELPPKSLPLMPLQ